MSDFLALLRAAAASDPADVTPVLAAADWCGEHDKPTWELALRYMAARKFRPFFRTDVRRRPWQWLPERRVYRAFLRDQIRQRAAAVIPASVWLAMPPKNTEGEWRDYPSASDAIAALTDGFTAVRTDVTIPDLPPKVVKPADVKLVACAGCGVALGDWLRECPVCKRERGE